MRAAPSNSWSIAAKIDPLVAAMSLLSLAGMSAERGALESPPLVVRRRTTAQRTVPA